MSEVKLAATIIILRQVKNKAQPFEVFLVKRHYQIDFASGALVFPGGKVCEDDYKAAVRLRSQNSLNTQQKALYIAAIRETFEEAGILYACRGAEHDNLEQSTMMDLGKDRQKICNGDILFSDWLVQHDLYVLADQLLPFAHWITPEFMPKRFDTHFFLSVIPDQQRQLAGHDGQESIDSIWITPTEALEKSKQKQYSIIFPTRMNLAKLTNFDTLDQLFSHVTEQSIVTVHPEIKPSDKGDMLCIPKEAGYPLTQIPLKDIG